MNGKRPARRDVYSLHFICIAMFVCVSVVFAAPASSAQDIAEAARQEKARKDAQLQKQPAHVYTNDDLQRQQILAPEDRAAVEARKKNSAPSLVNGEVPSNAKANDSAAPESLGEIARRVRREKAARQAEQAHKSLSPSPFHMELPKDLTLAHPKPSSQPLVVVRPAPKSDRPEIGVGAVKRDPFSRNVIPAAPHNSISSALAPKLVVPSTSSPSVVQPMTARPLPIDSKSRPGTVQVQSGDSLWNLSRRYLGRGSLWHEWLNHNPGLGDPRRIQPGAELRIPPLEPRAKYSSNTLTDSGSVKKTPGTISVRPGDSLWKIAAQHLRKGSEWPCLARANPSLRDVALIYPGQILVIPSACALARASSEAATLPLSDIP